MNLKNKIIKIKDKFNKYNGNEYKYVIDCLDTESKQKDYVDILEKKFSKIFNAKYSIAFNSGTSTLHACLYAAGVGYGDEVIIPSQTVIMCTFAVLAQNAVPVYADIDKDTFNIDPKNIEKKITKKTKAIIAVHMHGLPAQMDEIMRIAKKNNLIVIEDSAQCVFGKIGKKSTGSFGHFVSYSFETKKHISGFEGGMVTTNDKDFAERVRKFGGLGYKTLRSSKSLSSLLPSQFQNPFYKRHDSLGLNYRMNKITAALVLGQLEKSKFLVSRRIKIANFFLESIKNCKWLVPQYVQKGVRNTYWTFALKYYGDKFYGISWNTFYDMFKKLGGDGFYGGLSIVPDELILRNVSFIKNFLPNYKICGYCNIKNKEKCINKNLSNTCNNAYEVQPRLMQFKTNYRSLQQAKIQAIILKKLIQKIDSKNY
jgi:perosamine synthetase